MQVLLAILVVVLVLAVASTAYALDDFNFGLGASHLVGENDAYIGHSVQYSVDGNINLEKQAGHELSTGARMRQVITGEGSMSKESAILMHQGNIRVMDEQDWQTAEDALRNLKVTTSIKLTTPSITENDAALTHQIWAVSVAASPGHSGQLYQDFEASFEPGLFEELFGRDNDYFIIEQQAGMSEGTLRRYIDISSPVSGGLLYEDMRVDGMAYVNEVFSLINTRGVDTFWHELF